MQIRGLGKKVLAIKGYSQDVVKTFDRPIDFLFIDGNHDYPFVKQDFELWAPRLAPGGLLLFHDVDIDPSTAPMDMLMRENSADGIFGPARLIKESVISSDQFIGKTYSEGMFYCWSPLPQ